MYLPANDVLAGRRAALVVMPGGGYNRRYFDLPVPGYSQAGHHARQGAVVVAIDHLGAGHSSVPPLEVTTLPTVAAANHAAVSVILARLRQGTLAADVPPVDLASVTGAGQSLGGHALAAMQARHQTFDGVAMLGSSMAGTTMPVRAGAPEAAVPDGTTPEQAALLTLATTDWNWVFHWEDTPVPDIPRTPDDGPSLVAADIASGLPARQAAPEWGSLTAPGFAAAMMLPGVAAREAARIDVPVLLATGERDVCRSPAEEVAAFKAATDISVFAVPRMAHMHNFAATRTLLWERLDEFIAHVTRTTELLTRCTLRSRLLAKSESYRRSPELRIPDAKASSPAVAGSASSSGLPGTIASQLNVNRTQITSETGVTRIPTDAWRARALPLVDWRHDEYICC